MVDQFLKRLCISYLGFTASLWLIAFGMDADESAYPENPAWQLVSGLRFYFTLPLVAALAIGLCVALIGAWLEVQERRQKALEARARAEVERLESEELS